MASNDEGTASPSKIDDGDGVAQTGSTNGHASSPSRPTSTSSEAAGGRLHDLLSIGEIESALPASTHASSNGEPTSGGSCLEARLPLILRWLSAAQPLANVASSETSKQDGKYASSLPNPDRTVPLLEDVAASHPNAENVELLVSALAPSVCKDTIGKLPPLSRRKTQTNSTDATSWNTENLDVALERLSTHGVYELHKRHQEQLHLPGKRQKIDSADGYIATHADGDDSDMESADKEQDMMKVEASTDSLSSFFARASSAANDSHEAALRSALRELVGLVKASLRSAITVCGPSLESGHVDTANAFFKETGFVTPGLSVQSDSLFAEKDSMMSSIGGGWSGLAVMLPILMHHSPVLRHEHVALTNECASITVYQNALCRAALPQTPNLIVHMAANCPSSIPCLLRGIINAYQLSEKYKQSQSIAANSSKGPEAQHSGASVPDIIRTSVESIQQIASLSQCEAYNAITMLKELNIMDELVLSLLIEHDSVGAVSFIVEKLSSSLEVIPRSSSTHGHPDTSGEDVHCRSRGFRRRKVKFECSLSLRQRMMTGETSVNPSLNEAKQCISNLQKVLVADKSLAERAKLCVSKCIASAVGYKQNGQGTLGAGFGEIALIVQAYALLVYCTGIVECETTIKIIGSLPSLMTTSEEDIPNASSSDGVYKLALCTAIIVSSKMPQDENESSVAKKACLECIQSLLSHPMSINGIIFASRLVGFIKANDVEGLGKLVLSIICATGVGGGRPLPEKHNASQLSHICRWLSSKMEDETLETIHRQGFTASSVMHDPIAVVEAMRRSNSQTSNNLDDLVKAILSDPIMCSEVISNQRAGEMVQEAVKMLTRRPSPHIPLILPLTLERLVLAIPWGKVGSKDDETNKLLSQFVMQLLYALAFLEDEPESPFVINPRSLPLKESLCFVSLSKQSGGKSDNVVEVKAILKESISKHCPDIIKSMETSSWRHTEKNYQHVTAPTPAMFCKAIQAHLRAACPTDPSGTRLEQMFTICSSTYPMSEVSVAVVGGILATKHSQPKFYSYIALCKDPLLLMKASASVWKCRGIRCVILRVLQNLLAANECISMKCSSERTALEYLSARDAVIVRCILFACQCGFVFESSDANTLNAHCEMSVNMIRLILSRRQGIVATLIKQGLSDQSVDWLVECVPESFVDAPMLLSLLSEKGLLTAPERLQVADASLRIAIVNSKGEAVADRLVNASLSVLVDLFQLAIGPVGVPVSILREENGEDATSICRNAMFRMLDALATINPKYSLNVKDSAIMAISRLVTYSNKHKSDLAGVTGAVASRRKALFNEIAEKCSKANKRLGCAIQI
eukprot:scaffold1917_cov196-Alexandrium_tamarense.AAC.8